MKGKEKRVKMLARPFEYATRISLILNCFSFVGRFDILSSKTEYFQFGSIRAVLIHI